MADRSVRDGIRRSPPVSIDQLRDRIDALDERLVELLNERASCALAIGEIKKTLGVEIYQPNREAQVLEHVRGHGAAIGGPLGPEALTRLFERIIDEARRLERESASRPEHGN
jgi:chorismate mutase